LTGVLPTLNLIHLWGKWTTYYEIALICLNACVAIYGYWFFFLLGGFAIYTNTLNMKNTTSNEKLRNKWNFKHKNLKSNDVSSIAKFNYFYFSQNFPSRLQLYYATSDHANVDNLAVLDEYGVDLRGAKGHPNNPIETVL